MQAEPVCPRRRLRADRAQRLRPYAQRDFGVGEQVGGFFVGRDEQFVDSDRRRVEGHLMLVGAGYGRDVLGETLQAGGGGAHDVKGL